MRPILWGLTVLALALAPAASLAQTTPDTRKATRAEEPARPASTGFRQTMKDSWITTKAKTLLVSDRRVAARHIKVETHAGVITLRGKVSSAEERSAAEEISRDIGGAASVSSALQIVPDVQRSSVDAKDDGIEKAVKGRLDKDDRLKTADITVRADNSMVTLIGTVPDAKARTRASEVARGVPGVRSVRNELAPRG